MENSTIFLNGISLNTFTKLSDNEYVSMEVFVKRPTGLNEYAGEGL
jgi:hypothetical protein